MCVINRPLIEHFYLEDKRYAIMQVACDASDILLATMLLSKLKEDQRSTKIKTPEKAAQLKIPTGQKALYRHSFE